MKSLVTDCVSPFIDVTTRNRLAMTLAPYVCLAMRVFSVAGLALVLAGPVRAQNFTVLDGQTVGPQTMNNPGDTGTIEEGGAINGGGARGVLMLSTGQTVTNGGSISTTGNDAEGILSVNDALIANSGRITTTGDFSDGIESTGSGVNLITNSGSIFTAGDFASGILVGGANSVTINGGSIFTTGNSARGIIALSANSAITNRGSISTTGDFAYGITALGANSVITNRGSISTTGDFAYGIYSSGASSVMTNGGSISTTGTNSYGIHSTGADGQVINSGRITSTQADAIVFLGAQDNILTLLPGSILEGGLTLGGGTDTLVVGNGHSIAHTFDKVPDVLDTNGAPFVINGTQVIVVDPTGFTASDIFLADLTSSVFNSVDNNISKVGRRFWFSGFGGIGDVDATSPLVGLYHRFGGGMVGAEYSSGNTSLGLLGGGADSVLDVEYDIQDIDIKSAFGGAYWKHDSGTHRINLVLIGGAADHSFQRRVANNLVVGGIETASAGYNGWFLAPSATLAAPVGGLNASLRVNYAGLFMDGYSETGITNPLTVASRDIHLLGMRAQLAYPFIRFSEDGSHTHIECRGGVEGQQDLGSGDVSALVAGLPLSFSGNADDQFLGFLGGSLNRCSSDNLRTVGLSGQAAFGSGTYQLQGEVRATMRY